MLSLGLTSSQIFKKINSNNKKFRTVSDDLKYGYGNEENVLNILNKTFNDIFINTKEKYGEYHNYDFEGTSTGLKIEMKSRRIKHDDFSTTIIPVHKCVNPNSPNLFVFYFTDGIYYIEYDKTKFEKYEIKYITSNRYNKFENKPHYHINIEDLIKIENNS